jgi:hypothetical protein
MADWRHRAGAIVSICNNSLLGWDLGLEGSWADCINTAAGVGAMVVAVGERANTTFLSVSDNVPNCAARAARFVCIGIVIVDNPLQKGQMTCAYARREYPTGSRKTRKTYFRRIGGS